MYDVIIIGGGPAGMTAGIYTARAGYKTMILEIGVPGGQAATTELIENYPGFPTGVNGPELMMKFYEQTVNFGVEMVFEQVSTIDVEGAIKKVTTNNGTYEARSVIIASGAKPKLLGVPGEGKFRGRGVSYCATCDGFFFKDMEVAVVGGGDTAVEEALYLAKFCSKVTIIHRRDRLRANQVAQERSFKNEKVEIIYDTVIEEIVGEDKVTGLQLKNVKTEETSTLPVAGAFIFVGYTPNNDFFPEVLTVDQQGYIIANEDLSTNIPGVFVVGDVRRKALRQVTTAVGDGGLVLHAIEKHLGE